MKQVIVLIAMIVVGLALFAGVLGFKDSLTGTGMAIPKANTEVTSLAGVFK